MSTEAMRLALEALKDNQHLVTDNERHVYVMEYNSIIEKLEEALANHCEDNLNMVKQKQNMLDKEDIATAKEIVKVLRESKNDELVVAGNLIAVLLAEREPQPKQEQGGPMAADDFFQMLADKNRSPFSTQKRTWVGLTEEDIDFQAKKDDHAAYFALGALWAAAVLKDKNT